MPRQNRVDPFGRIVVHPARGTLMGNRGCLHDDEGRIVRTSARPAWISCLPSWPGVRRPLFQPGHYTELFFLDEATAMAAGHRPCGSCRPDALAAFKAAWQRAFGLAHVPRVAEIDQRLRSAGTSTRASIDPLPNGAMVATPSGQPLLRWRGKWLAWTHAGYEPCFLPPAAGARLLTSAAMIETLRTGYAPVVHPSADRALAVTPPVTIVSASERA